MTLSYRGTAIKKHRTFIRCFFQRVKEPSGAGAPKAAPGGKLSEMTGTVISD